MANTRITETLTADLDIYEGNRNGKWIDYVLIDGHELEVVKDRDTEEPDSWKLK